MAKRNMEAIEARRIEGARLLKTGVAQSEVVRRLGVTRQSVHIWAGQLAQANGTIGKLKAKPLGRPKHLDAAQCERLRALLVRGALAAGFPTELWTIKRVRALVKREFGVSYRTTGAWELLRSLGFSPQKPEKRALQRDEQAIVRWKRKTWPALKTNPQRGTNHRLRRRVAIVREVSVLRKYSRLRSLDPSP